VAGVLARTVLGAALIGAAPAAAQDYPRRQIELTVPFVAGGTTDTIARMIAQRFTDNWSQTVVVNNRPGGGGTIGTNAVAKAAPDGYTLLVTTIAFAINAGLQRLTYDPIKDFAPISELASIPLMLVVHPSVPATNLAEFIELAKTEPGGLDYASSGPGTSPHLAAEMFKSMAGVELVHVPFKGNAEVLNALLGGHVKIHFGLRRRSSSTSRPETCGRSPSPPKSACPICPTCPPSPSGDFPDMRSARGRACSRPPARRRTSSPRSTASLCAWCAPRRSAPAWRRKAPIRSAAGRTLSPSG
jgi:hypothetical protein